MNLFLIAALLATPRLPHGKHAPAPSVQEQPMTADEVRERVDSYLSSIDRPVDAGAWRALGPRAAEVLEPIATDANAFPSRRARALEGLVAAAPDRAAQLVGAIARDEKQPAVLRVAALRGAGQVLPPSRALSELKPVMQSARSAGMRGAAAEVLAGSKGACSAVREQAARERPAEQPAYERALKKCAE
jgi:hypothetical protein